MELEFRDYSTWYFTRLCRGYADALDDTQVRGWLPGVKNVWDNGGTWLMSSRMFPALAAWLSDPQRPRVLETRGRSYDLEELALAVLERAFDPRAAGYWGGDELPPLDQRTVEASVLGYGMWLLRDSLIPQLSDRTVEQVSRWLRHFSSSPPIDNNWSLFWIVTQASCKALGWEHDESIIEDGWHRIEGFHRGDGWFTDGHEGAFDDYNWWVFGTHGLMWSQLDGDSNPALRERLHEWSRQRLEDYPYFFGGDGAYTEYGRSLSYKFARLGFPLLARQQGLWPHSAGLLKRLVRRHLAFYDDVGAIDRRTDVVRQELSEFGHPDVRESYIDTGHPYWCMQAFAALWQVESSDELWVAEEEPLPVERADFLRAVRPAGWLLSGTKSSGHVQRHSLGSSGAGAKYAKFTYSSHFPVNVGTVEADIGPDACLCITDGERWSHPAGVKAFATGPDHLRARYDVSIDAVSVSCESILVPHGDGVLRVHRIRVPDGTPPLTLREGGLPFGYAAGAPPQKFSDAAAPWSLVAKVFPGAASWIYGLQGYARALHPQGFKGRDDLNLIHQFALTPLLEAELAPDGNLDLVSYCRATIAPMIPGQFTLTAAPVPPEPPEISVSWQQDGDVHISLGGATLVVPSLPTAPQDGHQPTR